MNRRGFPIYLITGLIIGLALGVAYAWIWTPVEAIETHPQDLRSDFKNAYRELIARAYMANNDLGRASQRLALLGDDDPARALAVQAQLTLSESGTTEAAKALGYLAAALQNEPLDPVFSNSPGPTQISQSPGPSPAITEEPIVSPTTTISATQETPTTPSPSRTTETTSQSESTPTITITLTPTPTPTATQGPPFVLLDIPLECNPEIDLPLIKVYVYDGAGNPVPGVAIIVSWDDGKSDRFVTGLKPEYGLGYADFIMDPAVTYSLRLEDGGDPVNSITGRLCEDQDEPYWGSWRLNFVQP